MCGAPSYPSAPPVAATAPVAAAAPAASDAAASSSAAARDRMQSAALAGNGTVLTTTPVGGLGSSTGGTRSATVLGGTV